MSKTSEALHAHCWHGTIPRIPFHCCRCGEYKTPNPPIATGSSAMTVHGPYIAKGKGPRP